MHWVGVPIIMAVNNYHHYLERETFTRQFYSNKKEKQAIEADENHRVAFMNRVNAVEFNHSHDGKTKFPYNANDLANYLLFLCHEDDLKRVKVPNCDPKPNNDEESTQIYENVMDSSSIGTGNQK